MYSKLITFYRLSYYYMKAQFITTRALPWACFNCFVISRQYDTKFIINCYPIHVYALYVHQRYEFNFRMDDTYRSIYSVDNLSSHQYRIGFEIDLNLHIRLPTLLNILIHKHIQNVVGVFKIRLI